jgi:glycerol-1-phosphate dehydrogenase [NAD(P)+]
MIQLPYDPANGKRFWDAISKLDGYPRNEHMPIKHMLFESDALFKTSRILESIGADKSNPLLVVMDQTTMQRGDDSLKPLAIRALQNDGWQIKPLVMLPDKSGQIHTEMPRIKGVQARLTRGCALLSIGSGVITDIAKHACYLYQKETGEKIPFVVYQTANSA